MEKMLKYDNNTFVNTEETLMESCIGFGQGCGKSIKNNILH